MEFSDDPPRAGVGSGNLPSQNGNKKFTPATPLMNEESEKRSGSNYSPQGFWQRRRKQFASNNPFTPPPNPQRSVSSTSQCRSGGSRVSPTVHSRERNASRNISPGYAREKCSYLRRIRLQVPTHNSSPSRMAQRFSSRRSLPADLKNFRQKYNTTDDFSLALLKYRRDRDKLAMHGHLRRSTDTKENTGGNSAHNTSFNSDKSDELHSSWEYNSSFDGSEEDSVLDMVPMLKSYQLLGDSLLVRFAEQILNQEVRMIRGTRTIGLCVSGQKLMDLLHKVSMKEYPVGEKVVLLIGTNDILQNTRVKDMQDTLQYLLHEILIDASRVVLLTIPPIPKLQDQEDQWERIETYNLFIKSLKDERISVADIHELYLAEPRNCKMECFEKYYGDSLRKDLIHLNRVGLNEIYNFLTKNNFLV